MEVVDELPRVLVIGPPLIMPFLESKFPNRFQFLKPWNSHLPLTEFLTTHAHAHSVQALLIRGGIRVLTTPVLDCLPSLKLVVTTSVGVDHLALDYLRRRGVAIAYAEDVYSEDVADLAVGLLIDVFRKLSAGDRISYNSRTKKPFVSYSYYPNVRDLAIDCDALIICCGINEETRHMINREVMVALGKDGVIINIGRGAIIDEKEMVQCLIRGEIGGAGLDVFENEPLVPKQLFDLDNVVLSPHVAVLTNESLMDMSKLVVDNLEAFFSNKPLVSPYVG